MDHLINLSWLSLLRLGHGSTSTSPSPFYPTWLLFCEFISMIKSHNKLSEVFCIQIVHELSSASSLCGDQGWCSDLPLKLPALMVSQQTWCTKKIGKPTGGIGPINSNETKHLVLYGNVQHIKSTHQIRKTKGTCRIKVSTHQPEDPSGTTIKIARKRLVYLWQYAITEVGIKVSLL